MTISRFCRITNNFVAHITDRSAYFKTPGDVMQLYVAVAYPEIVLKIRESIVPPGDA